MERNKRTKQKMEYNMRSYDRLGITVPKGHKATLQRAAEAEGESINSYVNKAVLARMGLEEWPETAEE